MNLQHTRTAVVFALVYTLENPYHRRSQYEANRGTRLGKILPNTVDFYFFIRLIILEDFIRLISYNGPCVRLGCSFFLAAALPMLQNDSILEWIIRKPN